MKASRKILCLTLCMLLCFTGCGSQFDVELGNTGFRTLRTTEKGCFLTDGDQGIWSLDMETGDQTFLAKTEPGGILSSDGAYAYAISGGYVLRTNLATGEEETIFRTDDRGDVITSPLWATERFLLYQSNVIGDGQKEEYGGVWVLDLSTLETVRMLEYRDGDLFSVYCDRDDTIFAEVKRENANLLEACDLGTGATQTLNSWAGNEPVPSCAVLVGDQLFYLVEGEMFSLPLDSGAPAEKHDAEGIPEEYILSGLSTAPTGLLLAAEDPKNENVLLYQLDTETMTAEKIVRFPDGRYVAYLAAAEGRYAALVQTYGHGTTLYLGDLS